MSDSELKQLKLTNYVVEKGMNKWNKEFFKIISNNDNNIFFCFKGTVKEGWNLLESGTLTGEIEIDYKEKPSTENDNVFRHVVHIYQDLLV